MIVMISFPTLFRSGVGNLTSTPPRLSLYASSSGGLPTPALVGFFARERASGGAAHRESLGARLRARGVHGGVDRGDARGDGAERLGHALVADVRGPGVRARSALRVKRRPRRGEDLDAGDDDEDLPS